MVVIPKYFAIRPLLKIVFGVAVIYMAIARSISMIVILTILDIFNIISGDGGSGSVLPSDAALPSLLQFSLSKDFANVAKNKIISQD